MVRQDHITLLACVVESTETLTQNSESDGGDRCHRTHGECPSIVRCVCLYLQRLAGHQTLTTELLQSCKAGPLQPVKALYVDSMLREPCKLVMQGNYAAIAAEAASALQPGHLTAADMQLADTLQNLADVQQELQQRRAVDQVQRAVQGLQQAEQEQQLAAETQTVTMQEQPVLDQQDSEALRFSGVFTAAKPFPGKAAAASEPAAGANLGRAGRKKRQGRATKPRTSAAGSAANPVQASAGSPGKHTGEQPAGVTPLMQKLEGMQAVQDAEAAAHRYTAHCCLQAWDACELDVRQWLVAGMLEALQQDAAAVVARCRYVLLGALDRMGSGACCPENCRPATLCSHVCMQ